MRRHNDGSSETDIRSAVWDFIIRTGLAARGEVNQEESPADGFSGRVDLTARDTCFEFKRSLYAARLAPPRHIAQPDGYLTDALIAGRGIRNGVLTDGKRWIRRRAGAEAVADFSPPMWVLENAGAGRRLGEGNYIPNGTGAGYLCAGQQSPAIRCPVDTWRDGKYWRTPVIMVVMAEGNQQFAVAAADFVSQPPFNVVNFIAQSLVDHANFLAGIAIDLIDQGQHSSECEGNCRQCPDSPGVCPNPIPHSEPPSPSEHRTRRRQWVDSTNLLRRCLYRPPTSAAFRFRWFGYSSVVVGWVHWQCSLLVQVVGVPVPVVGGMRDASQRLPVIVSPTAGGFTQSFAPMVRELRFKAQPRSAVAVAVGRLDRSRVSIGRGVSTTPVCDFVLTGR